MRLHYFLAVLALVAIACSTLPPQVNTPTQMLNSERIKQKFGSYGVEVIPSPIPGQRVSNLFSTHNGQKICRTFAVTRFEENLDPALKEAHRRIVEQNESIGSTFKELGFTVNKENLSIETFEPKTVCLFRMMGQVEPAPLAVYIYRLTLSKGELQNIPYAVIAEIQHPDYLSKSDLLAIYGHNMSVADLKDAWVSIYAALGNLGC